MSFSVASKVMAMAKLLSCRSAWIRANRDGFLTGYYPRVPVGCKPRAQQRATSYPPGR
jgi:hypothetical protein